MANGLGRAETGVPQDDYVGAAGQVSLQIRGEKSVQERRRDRLTGEHGFDVHQGIHVENPLGQHNRFAVGLRTSDDLHGDLQIPEVDILDHRDPNSGQVVRETLPVFCELGGQLSTGQGYRHGIISSLVFLGRRMHPSEGMISA